MIYAVSMQRLIKWKENEDSIVFMIFPVSRHKVVSVVYGLGLFKVHWGNIVTMPYFPVISQTIAVI